MVKITDVWRNLLLYVYSTRDKAPVMFTILTWYCMRNEGMSHYTTPKRRP
jgi:hypothetical protein